MGKASRRKKPEPSIRSSLYRAKKPPIPDRFSAGTVEKVLPETITLKSYIEGLVSVEVITCTSAHCKFNLAQTGTKSVHVPAEVLHLLQSTKVLPDLVPRVFEIPPPEEPRAPMKEMLLRFIDYQLKGCRDYKMQNCLTLGYRFKSANCANALRQHESLECFYVNTLHAYFGNIHWQMIARTFGELVVRHVLSRPLFVPAPNNCYLQLAGMPVHETLRCRPPSNSKSKKSQSHQLNTFNEPISSIPKPLNTGIVNETTETRELVRFSIFYNTKYTKSPGLEKRHILNKVHTSSALLFREIFSSGGEFNHSDDDTESTEVEDREKDILAVLDDVLQAYRRTSVARLLQVYCPVPLLDPVESSEAAVIAQEPQQEPDSEETPSQGIHESLVSNANQDISEIISNVPQPRRKTRRGCRGGQKRKQAVHGHAPSSPPSTEKEIDPWNGGQQFNRKPQVQVQTLVTVGDRLIHRARRLRRRVGRGRSDAVEDPDHLTDHVPTLAPLVEDVKSQELSDTVGPQEPSQKTLFTDELLSRSHHASKSVETSANLVRAPDTDDRSEDRHKTVSHTCVAAAVSKELNEQSTEIEVEQSGSDKTSFLGGGVPPDCGLRHHFRSRPHLTVLSNSTSSAPRDVPVTLNATATATFPFLPRFVARAPSPQFHRDPLSQIAPDLDADFKGALAAVVPELNLRAELKRRANESVSDWRKRLKIASSEGVIDRSKLNVNSIILSDAIDNTDDLHMLQCPIENVSKFIRAVCRHTFPMSVWGSRRNFNLFMAALDTYVNLDRHDNFTLHQLTHRFKLKTIPWLFIGRLQDTPPQTSFRQFMRWVFESFVNPLLSNCFYITEGEGAGNACLHYRKPVWAQLMKRGREQMKKNFIEVSLASSFSSARQSKALLPSLLKRVPSVRFVPKKSSLRAITNFRRTMAPTKGPPLKDTRPGREVVTNAMLYNCLHILKHIYNSCPVHGGFGVMHVDEVFYKLKHFKATVLTALHRPVGPSEMSQRHSESSSSLLHSRNSRNLPQLYMASLDLEKCYDNVDTAKLYDLLKDLISIYDQKVFGANEASKSTSSDQINPFDLGLNHPAQSAQSVETERNVILHRYMITHYIKSLERSITRTVRHLTPVGDIVPIRDAIGELARSYPNSIITDGVVYPHIGLSEVLRLLRLHLFSHVVKLPVGPADRIECRDNEELRARGFVPFTQVKGIPQGSVLSPILCNLYYGRAEQAIFGSSEENIQILGLIDKTLILRWMDDYFVVSVDKTAVEVFLQKAHCEFQRFGGGVNPLKTKVNFDTEIVVDGKSVRLKKIEGDCMYWCGYSINTSTLEVTPNFQRLLDRPMRTSVSVDSKHVGVSLRKSLKSFVRMKCVSLVLDAQLNSRATVVTTIYQLFLMAAMRAHAFLTTAHTRYRTQWNMHYLCRCLEETIHFGTMLIKSRTKKKILRTLNLGSSKPVYDDANEPDNAFASIVHNYQYRRLQTLYNSKCSLSSSQVGWLASKAFEKVVNEFPEKYSDLALFLKSKVNLYESNIKPAICELFLKYLCEQDADSLLAQASWQ